jgi:hypothetical protein
MKSRIPNFAAVLGLAVTVTLAGCAQSAPPVPARHAALPLHWSRFRHLPGVVDFAGPAGDGSLTVAAGSRLLVLSRSGALTPFARGPGGYIDTTGSEAYITTTGTDPVAGAHCSFRAGTTFALRLGRRPGIILISADGRARPFATLPAGAFPSGITFDSVGRFGHRLLVTDRGKVRTAVLAIDCTGGVRVITTQAPRMEGGIAVAPASFGGFGGDLVAPDEGSGRVYAIAPDGAVVTLAESGQPVGGDIGVESTGFVPPGFGAGGFAYLADRITRNSKHAGTDSILRLSGHDLIAAGARPGDLLVAAEGAARTILVRCSRACTVRYVGTGFPESHAEGHIAFTSPGG